MTKKIHLSWQKTGALLHEVIRQIQSDPVLINSACKWQPDYVKYDWSHFLPNTDGMCEQCFNAYDRLGKIKWKCESVAPKV